MSAQLKIRDLKASQLPCCEYLKDYMEEKMEKLFLNKKTLIAVGTLTIALFAAWGISVINFPSSGGLYVVYAVIYLALTVALMVAYKKGETNCQKVLIAALLMFIIRDELDVTFLYLGRGDGLTLKTFLIGLSLLLFTMFLINYICMLSDHVGYRSLSAVNNILLILLFFVHAAFVVVYACEGHSTDGILLKAATFACVLLISCINMRVQKYKRIRAEAKANGTWNEETRQEAKKLFIIN